MVLHDRGEVWHLGKASLEHRLQLGRHLGDLELGGVVPEAVGKHCADIRRELLGLSVHPVLEALRDCAKVHWALDDIVVVVQVEGGGVNRLQEGPRDVQELLARDLLEHDTAKLHRLRELRLFVGSM